MAYLGGIYDIEGTVNGRDYWTKDGFRVRALWYSIWNGWRMASNSSLGGSSGLVFGPDTNCPRDQTDGWRYYDGSAIVDSCKDIQWKCLSMFSFVLKFILLEEMCSTTFTL